MADIISQVKVGDTTYDIRDSRLSYGATVANLAPTASAGTATTVSRSDHVHSDRLFSTLVPTGTSIGSNANLNTTTYLKVGRYYCSANATVATLTNCPVTDAFMMVVYSPLATTIDNETTKTWCYRLRELTTYTGTRYLQYCYAGATAGSWTYGAWTKFYMDKHFATSSAFSAGTKLGSITIDGTTTNYYAPTATSSTYGAVKVSSVNSSAVTVNSESTTAGRYYPIELNNDGKAIVNIPWTDTTYSNFVKSGSGARAGLVPAPSTTAGTTKYLREDGTWQVPPDNNTTYTFNGAVSTIKDSNLTANRALISNSSGKVAVSDITATELGYLDGVTSSIQAQLNGKAASSHSHTVSQISDFPVTPYEKQLLISDAADSILRGMSWDISDSTVGGLTLESNEDEGIYCGHLELGGDGYCDLRLGSDWDPGAVGQVLVSQGPNKTPKWASLFAYDSTNKTLTIS